MPFIGKNPTSGFSTIVKDDLTPDGSTTGFTLSKNVASANDIAVFVGNVRQEPTDAYSVSGTTLTMTAAPASGLNFYVLHIAGTLESSVIPADDTITTAKIVDANITTAKLDSTLDLSGKTVTMPAGSVLQVVSTTKTDTYSQTATSYTEVTGLTASITPISSSSKILIIVGVKAAYDDDGTTSRRAAFSIFRGSTNLIVPTSPSNRIGGMVEIMENVKLYGSVNIGYSFLDSPATTSSTSYSVRAKNHGGGSSILYVNRGSDDEDSSITVRGASTITLMEIAG